MESLKWTRNKGFLKGKKKILNESKGCQIIKKKSNATLEALLYFYLLLYNPISGKMSILFNSIMFSLSRVYS